MKNKFLTFLLLIFLLFSYSCKKEKECKHNWIGPTCTTPKTCTICGETQDILLSHNYSDWIIDIEPTCKSEGSKHIECTICHKTIMSEVMEKTDHIWVDATYENPRTCNICGITSGKPLTLLNYTLTNNYTQLGKKARIRITNYLSLDNFNIQYTNDDIISIDNYGTIIGLKEGKTTVTISLINDPNCLLNFDFEVIRENPIVTTNLTKMGINDVANIYFKNTDDKLIDYDVTFSKGGLLELTDDYLLRALNLGTENITLTLKSDPRISTNFDITIVDGNENLLIYAENNDGIMKQNAQMKMFNNMDLSNLDLVWGTTDKNVIIVSEKGIVTAISEGYATVYAQNTKTKQTVNYNIQVSGTANVDYISRFIHIALDENGIHETDPTGSYPSSDNYQKYGKWYPNNGQPWCAMFVSWCWHFSGLSNNILCKYQGCTAGMKWCTEKGIMHFVQNFDFGNVEMENGVSTKQYAEDYKPVTGDIVFFLSSGMSHTGIAIYSDEEYLYTIEGNTSDQVAIKRWSLNDARITGYAHPEFPPYEGEREDFSWIKNLKGDGTYWWKPVSLVEKVD